MIKISEELAPVLVAAIRDATKFNSALVHSEGSKIRPLLKNFCYISAILRWKSEGSTRPWRKATRTCFPTKNCGIGFLLESWLELKRRHYMRAAPTRPVLK